jgi:HlyD family secretion protein
MQPIAPRLIPLFCVTLLAGLLPDLCRSQETSSPVIVAPVVEREIHTGHRVVGTVMPARTSIVGSAVDGRVMEYLVRAGDPVAQGDVLARLLTQTLEIELAAAKAQLAIRDAELAELEAGSRPQDIEEARASARRAAIVQQNAEQKLQRAESLLARGAINQDEYESLREAALSAEQTRLAADAALSRTEEGSRKEVIDQSRAARQLQREQVRLIEDRLEKFIIRAPFDGFVSVEGTQQGEWIQTGDPIATIVQMDEVDVVANVPSEFAVRLSGGATVRVEFSQLPEELLTGTVTRIVPTADVSTRTYPVHVRMANRIDADGPLVLAGMLARLDLPTGSLARGLLVPKDALVLNRGQRRVLVVERRPGNLLQGRVRAVDVTPGVAVGNLMQVAGDLSADDVVVIRGNERLSDGQAVTIRETVGETASAE